MRCALETSGRAARAFDEAQTIHDCVQLFFKKKQKNFDLTKNVFRLACVFCTSVCFESSVNVV